MRANDRGLSLVELMVALAILGVVIVGLTRLADSSSRQAAKAASREDAQNLVSLLQTQLDRSAQRLISQDCGTGACAWTAFVRDTEYRSTVAAATQYYEYYDVICEAAPAPAALAYGTILQRCGTAPYPCGTGQRPVIRYRENPTKVPAGRTPQTRRFVSYEGAGVAGMSAARQVVASSICFTRQAGVTSAHIQVVGIDEAKGGKPYVVSKSHVMKRRQPGSWTISP